MRVLLIADYDENKLSPKTAKLVSAAISIGKNIDILVAGFDVKNIANEAAKLDGVSNILLADDETLKQQGAQVLCNLVKNIADDYDAILTSVGTIGRAFIPRLSAVLDIMPITDIIEIISPTTFNRPIYAGNAIKTISNLQDKLLATIRSGSFSPVAKNNNANIKEIEFEKITSFVKFIKSIRTDNNTTDLSLAQIVIGGGQAFETKENFDMLYKLADLLGASVGATRAAVELGLAPNESQIGQSGKIITPKLYIAFGISGALQHLAGINGAEKIIAINSDPEAPIMKIADVAFVGDLKEILPQLIKKLS